MHAVEVNGLFEQESAAGQWYVRLKEMGMAVERGWWVDVEGVAYTMYLALPAGDAWGAAGAKEWATL
jgi:hypothetical protein